MCSLIPYVMFKVNDIMTIGDVPMEIARIVRSRINGQPYDFLVMDANRDAVNACQEKLDVWREKEREERVREAFYKAQPGVVAVKFYKNGFRLLKTDETNKKYSYRNVRDVILLDENIVEVIHTEMVVGKHVMKSLTSERHFDDTLDVGETIMGYWERYTASK